VFLAPIVGAPARTVPKPTRRTAAPTRESSKGPAKSFAIGTSLGAVSSSNRRAISFVRVVGSNPE
jgi:hypothetical protein